LRKALSTDGYGRRHQGADHNEAIAHALIGQQIDHQHAAETHSASQRFALAQPVVCSDPTRQQPTDEGASAAEDGGFHANGAGQTNPMASRAQPLLIAR